MQGQILQWYGPNQCAVEVQDTNSPFHHLHSGIEGMGGAPASSHS